MIQKSLTAFFILLAVFVSFAGKITSAGREETPPRNFVRIAVVKDSPGIYLKIMGRYTLFTIEASEVLREGRGLRETKVSPLASGLKIGPEELGIYGVRIVPEKDSGIYVNNRRLRGNVDIIRNKNLKLLVVNHIDVEDYLRGVLYHEVSHWWPMEALKAQAIVARTYAIYQSRVNKNRDYDLTSDAYSQVYGGRISEKWRTDRAVKATRNQALLFNGDIFPAYYHATCGGHTEDASNLWNDKLASLRGIKCGFCEKSPHFYWEKDISLSDIGLKLNKAGFKIGRIKSINTSGRFESGRIKNVELKSESAALTVTAKDFRNALGNNFIRSTNFNVEVKGDNAYFEGYGWGHGVGMCQWGAYYMSKKRFKASEILKFYYPGTEIGDYKNDIMKELPPGLHSC